MPPVLAFRQPARLVQPGLGRTCLNQLGELALLEVSACVYTAAEKSKRDVFAPIMPAFDTPVSVSGLLVLLIPDRKTWMLGLTATGV